MLNYKEIALILVVAFLGGCSTFNDEIYVVIGEGSQIMAINSETQKATESEGKSSSSVKSIDPEGFECTFESSGEKPNIFSTKMHKKATLRCEQVR